MSRNAGAHSSTRRSHSPRAILSGLSPAAHIYNQQRHTSPAVAQGQSGGSSAYSEDDEDDDDENLEEDTDDESSQPPTSSDYSEPMQRSEEEKQRLGQEMDEMYESIPMMEAYPLVDKLGEGTFSTVYKAEDRYHVCYDNEIWSGKPNGHLSSKKPPYVALKRIYVTSSPDRIHNELRIMETLRDANYISYLITAFRAEDQIVAVMPYSRHRDFRDYYRIMPLSDMKCYFRCLFSALQSTHEKNVMHRDVKPANFLYDINTGHGTLCDFGLAEFFDPAAWVGKCHHTCPTEQYPFGVVKINQSQPSKLTMPGGPLAPKTNLPTKGSGGMGPPERPGYVQNDHKSSVRANRAGTRGFRAPEVLFKCQDQHMAIDIWSAGIILLAFLTKRFPIFNSNDDTEALMEIATIFGKTKMENIAMMHNRILSTNVPTIDRGSLRPEGFVRKLNPSIFSAERHSDPAQYKVDIRNAISLLTQCLNTDCTRRITAAQALEQDFLRIDDDNMPSSSKSVLRR